MLAPGDVVEVPLGPRRIAGVVWDSGVYQAAAIPEARLRAVARRLDMPPLRAPLRRLVDWVADYYLAAPSSVVRMALPRAAFEEVREPPSYARGPLPPPETVRHPARRDLLARLAALRDFGPAPLALWAAALGVST
ncbi:MAG: hypothetical protein ACK4MX_08105, partial [Thermaurantiacus sp.]